MVELEINDGVELKIGADSSEEVFGVYYVEPGNWCEVPAEAEHYICKVGESDCCIFLSLGEHGFRCQKFGHLASGLLDLLAHGNIIASRIGNCEVIGRKTS